MKAYMAGRYYMVGVGNYKLNVSANINNITYRLSELCPNIRIVTAVRELTLYNTDTVHFTAKKEDKYVRIEAVWDDGDFIYSNPIWID